MRISLAEFLLVIAQRHEDQAHIAEVLQLVEGFEQLDDTVPNPDFESGHGLMSVLELLETPFFEDIRVRQGHLENALELGKIEQESVEQVRKKHGQVHIFTRHDPVGQSFQTKDDPRQMSNIRRKRLETGGRVETDQVVQGRNRARMEGFAIDDEEVVFYELEVLEHIELFVDEIGQFFDSPIEIFLFWLELVRVGVF